MIYLDKPYVNISWDSEVRAVYAEWLGYADGLEYRDALDAGLDLFVQKRSSRWIGDARSLGPIAQENQQWTNEDWFPRIIRAGLRQLAVVSPRKMVVQMSVKRILSKVGDKEIVTAHFDKLEDARRWLKKQS